MGRYAFLGLLYLFVLLVLRALLAEMRAEVRLVAERRATPEAEPVAVAGPRTSSEAEESRPPQVPSQPLPPRLIVVESGAPSQLAIGTAFPLTAVTTIGRGAHNSVALPSDKHVSSNHALLFVRDGVIRLRDRGSTNGTYLNGVRTDDETPLEDGDRITVGTTVLRFCAQQVGVALSVQDEEAG